MVEKIMLFFSLVIPALQLSAQNQKSQPVIEIKSLEEVLKYADKPRENVVIFSIDNVLLSSDYQISTRQWFYHRIDLYQKKGLNDRDAVDRAIAEWTAVLSLVPQTIVDPKAPEVLEKLKKNQIRFLGLTSRGVGLSSRTIQHLKSFNIDLSSGATSQSDLPLMLGEKLLLYRNGVLFTSGSHKVMALKKLQEMATITQPKKIIMVSQSEDSLTLMEESLRLHSKGTEFIPLRLSIMDKQISEFDPNLADVQFEHFARFISNEEAKKLLNSKTPQVGSP
jgi:hypothetical protein